MATTLESLPVETRLEIHNHLLNLANMPKTYGYTNGGTSRHHPSDDELAPLRRHGMLLVNKELSEEYRQAFFERTQFFLYIDPTNYSLDPFWSLSPSLLPNVRNCKLYIEFKDILHAQKQRLKKRRPSRAKPSSQKQYNQYELLPGAETYADTYHQHETNSRPPDEQPAAWSSTTSQTTVSAFQQSFAARIFALLAQMSQLREMHFVWNVPTSYSTRTKAMEGRGAVWSVQAIERGDDELRDAYIETLKGMGLLRRGIVAMGTTVWRGVRVGREWVEEEF